MKKVVVFVTSSARDAALKRLRKLGVVHIQHFKPPMSDDISKIENSLSAVEKSLGIIKGYNKPLATEIKEPEKCQKLVFDILALDAEKQQIKSQIEEKRTLLNWYDRWGIISFKDVAELQENGIYLRLYEIDRSVLKSIPEGACTEILKEDKNQLKIAFITKSKNVRLDIKEEQIPREDFNTVTVEEQEKTSRLAEIDQLLHQLAESYSMIQGYQQELEKHLEFARVRSGMQDAEEITYLQGYCPADDVEKLMQSAATEGWGIMSDEPDATDNPPTLLKMNKVTQLIKPVFDFLGTVPGYREYDISQYFLVFFALFVAMIIGDAGYGTTFLLITIFAHYKSSQKETPLPEFLKLMYLLSLCTIGWGTITGNWFGAVQIAGLPLFKALTIPQLANFPELFPDLTVNPQQKVMLVCFVVAVVQLGLANIMNFINNLPHLKAMGNLGWFGVTAGVFLVVLKLVLGFPLPSFTVSLIVCSVLAVIVFMKQEKGISFLKGVALGLGDAFTTFLNVISSFSNIISYIRLFAVGMAGVAIATSFNQIAIPMLKGFTFPAGILVLIVGHGLNIVMSILSVVVHGIRLNILEFSGQLGMEWTGYNYEPFKEKNTK
ncbi:MAG: V-type ATPase 116kDa subunit family protein [Candidatus Marinimicrobia bacterium]|nr:V-type ATPase 116kDa subunit family protein [Candidatus Neomarinimicrobiota bacterium]